jgi:hypothetical protein
MLSEYIFGFSEAYCSLRQTGDESVLTMDRFFKGALLHRM